MPLASAGSVSASGRSVMTGWESMTSSTRITPARDSCPMVTRAVSIRTGPAIWAR
ncbi:MAG TPA: hypothetical protein VG268_19755 [Streptosporangiaceae bacterium]|nr:hypothetical protein [Streptosporangiaceae bacterium]